MGRIYTATIKSNAIAGPIGAFEITAKTNTVVVLHSAFIGQFSDAGDAQAEMLRVNIVRHDTAAAGGGTTVTPRPHNSNDTAFQGTAKTSNVWVATNAILYAESFNVQAGWYYTPTPEERIIAHGAKRLAIDVLGTGASGAFADSLTISARLTFEEI